MEAREVILFSAILAFAVLILCCLLDYKKPAEAKPVTTEIPEYIMKCTAYSGSCTEYTIYRITRN